MRKLTEITRELTPEFIEDSLDDFVYLLGFKIKSFNNIGGNKWGSNLYMPLSIDQVSHLFSYNPSPEHNYVGYIIILEKQITPFQKSEDNEYVKIDNSVKQLQRVLSNCNVYYRIKQTVNGITNRNTDTNPNLEVVIIIVDKSKKISDKVINFYNETKSKVDDILTSSRLARYYYTKFEDDGLSLIIYHYNDEINKVMWGKLISNLESSLKNNNLKYEKSESTDPTLKIATIYQYKVCYKN